MKRSAVPRVCGIAMISMSMGLGPLLGAPLDELQAGPTAVKLRTVALLLSDQQGGELDMAASLVRRPTADGLEAQVVAEIAGDDLARGVETLVEGRIEAFVYLLDSGMEVVDSVSAAWVPRIEDGTTSPVRLHVAMPVEQAGDYWVRLLVRAGDAFALRTLPLVVPAFKAPGPKVWEPRIDSQQQVSWQHVAPAGRGVSDPPSALTVLARDRQVTWTSPVSGESGAVAAELIRGDLGRRLEIESFDPETGQGRLTLPTDVAPGRYQFRLVSDLAPPSLAVPVMVVAGTNALARWTEVSFDTEEPEDFTGMTVEMPESEAQRLKATRRELAQMLVDAEDSFAAAGARLRALEVSLEEKLDKDARKFLGRQIARTAVLMARRTPHRPDVSFALAWLLLEHSAYHQRQGSHWAFRLSLDQAVEVLDHVAKGGAEGKETVAKALSVAAGRLQRGGRVRAAQELLERALRYRSDQHLALLTLAAIHERQGHPKDAVPLLRRALTAHPDELLTRLRLAVALQRLDQRSEADALYDQVLASPDAADGLRLLAYQQKVRMAFDHGRLDAARSSLDNGLRAFPDDPALAVARNWLAGQAAGRPGAPLDAGTPPAAPDRENPRLEFSAWPRSALDQAGDQLRAQAEVAAPLLAVSARRLLAELGS